jgi:hypothetical protein
MIKKFTLFMLALPLAATTFAKDRKVCFDVKDVTVQDYRQGDMEARRYNFRLETIKRNITVDSVWTGNGWAKADVIRTVPVESLAEKVDGYETIVVSASSMNADRMEQMPPGATTSNVVIACMHKGKRYYYPVVLPMNR